MLFRVCSERYGEDHPFKKVLSGMPETVWERLGIIGEFQVAAVQIAATHPYMRDLLVSNLVLFYLLVLEAVAGHATKGDLEVLAGTKQLLLLRRYRQDVSKATVKFLRKLRFRKGLSVRSVQNVMDRISPDLVCGAAAVPYVYEENLVPDLQSYPMLFDEHRAILSTILTTPFGRTRNRWLIGWTDQPRETLEEFLKRYNRLCRDIDRMFDVLDGDRRLLSRCDSLSDIERLHDRLEERVNERNRDQVWRLLGEDGDVAFPSPPFQEPGIFFQRLKDAKRLSEEGRTQRHCVVSYLDTCFYGESFVYAIRFPCRLTLELKVGSDGGVYVEQLVGFRNRMPPQDIKKLVLDHVLSVQEVSGTLQRCLIDFQYLRSGIYILLATRISDWAKRLTRVLKIWVR